MSYDDDILVIHQNSKRTFLSAELGFDEEHQTNTALVKALLSGQPLNGNNNSLANKMSKLRNLGKPNFKKQKFQSTERAESISSSSPAVKNVQDQIPLTLRSNDEVRKLAESAENCTENYIPVTSCETVQKLTRTLVVNLNSEVNAVTEFEVRGTCVLNTDSAKFPYNVSSFSGDQVGNSVDPNKSFAIDGVLYGENIVGELKEYRKVSSNQPQDSFIGIEDNTGSVSPSESLEGRHPSPVSVLESPLEQEKLHYKRVVADPQELQKQLDILKFELDRVNKPQTKREPLHLIEDIKLEFTCEEERDYSYLLDMMIDSGFHGVVDQKRLLRLCYDRHTPVGPMVLINLEKKYRAIGGWSVSERKFLFDLVNSILADILAPCMDLRPWGKSDRQLGPMWGQEGLVEKLWQILARKKELLPKGDPLWTAFDIRWIKLGDQIDLIAREIERSIKDDLLEELVSEFLSD